MENNLNTITSQEKKTLLSSLRMQMLSGLLLSIFSIGIFQINIFTFPETDKNITISILSVVILVSLFCIRYSFTFYSKGLEKLKTISGKEETLAFYKRINFIRQFVIWGCIIINIVLYYVLHDITFLMCAGMIVIVTLNMIPSLRKIDFELSLNENEE
ncbi:MAG: hypothetical protein Q4F97_07410 [Bacteroidales bacterium]|nr:hypothetical protein [Bacteroidales bacterium]